MGFMGFSMDFRWFSFVFVIDSRVEAAPAPAARQDEASTCGAIWRTSRRSNWKSSSGERGVRSLAMASRADFRPRRGLEHALEASLTALFAPTYGKILEKEVAKEVLGS